MIYEYCLVVRYELKPHPTDYERYEIQRPLPRRPDIALLGTNKQINAEAATVLYGKNLWRVSHQSNIAEQPEIWKKNVSLFRHVIVSFDFRDLHQSQLLELTLAEHRMGRSLERKEDRTIASDILHALRLYDVAIPWMAKVR